MKPIILALALMLPGLVWANEAIFLAPAAGSASAGRQSAEVTTAAQTALRRAGFEVQLFSRRGPGELAEYLQARFEGMDDGDHVIVYVEGDILVYGGRAYLLDPRGQTPLTRFNIGQRAFDLNPILHAMGEHPDRSVMLLSDDRKPRALLNLEREVPAFGAAPKGVGLVTGPRDALMRGAARLMREGTSTAAAFRGLKLQGTAQRDAPFLAPGTGLDRADRVAWQQAERAGTIQAYLAYLTEFSDGQFADAALARIAELREKPPAPPTAEEIEAALGLDRAARRQVQQNLSDLGFNPRGIDGVFGPGTRKAILAWQLSREFEPTSFLSGNQVVALEAQGDSRRREIAREDDAYWERTGALGGEDRLRAYLDRYPSGRHSEKARAQLAAFEEDRRKEGEARERIAWVEALRIDRADAYRDFLRRFPSGVYSAEAEARLAALSNPGAGSSDVAKAEAAEAQVLDNPILRLLAERRLAEFGFNPGSVDGRFTEGTRRAIRAFQKAAGIPSTGYIDRRTAAALISG
ncbi:MAG: peptidoglycan-binding domain-containing protein [Pseudomonadota bacterium]